MKTRTLLIFSFVAVLSGNGHAQKDTTFNTIPIYWTIDLGKTYLTSTHSVKNHNAPLAPTASGSWYFFCDIPARKAHSIARFGFIIAPGIGIGVSTFSINKILTENTGVVAMENPGDHYIYSFVQGYYLDVPVDFRYLTPLKSGNHNFNFELGGKAGHLLYSAKEIQVKEGSDVSTHTIHHVGILNTYRYGINAKAGYRKIHIDKNKNVMGIALSIIGNYYFSDVFIDQANIASKSFCIGLGMSFIWD